MIGWSNETFYVEIGLADRDSLQRHSIAPDKENQQITSAFKTPVFSYYVGFVFKVAAQLSTPDQENEER